MAVDAGSLDDRVAVVLRSLRGEVLADLSRETGLPRKQLSRWRSTFLAGGRDALGGHAPAELETVRGQAAELRARVEQLAAENVALDRRLALLLTSRAHPDHPLTSADYARAHDGPGLEVLPVPPWATSVLVSDSRSGRRHATGLRPHAGLAPDADVEAGLATIAAAGVTSVSLVTDPMWAPDRPRLEAAFESCRPFKTGYVIDRHAGPTSARKRHRNLANRARRATEVTVVALRDVLDRWLELYAGNVANRRIAQPFPQSYFEAIVDMPGLSTVAVVRDGRVVTVTLWVRHGDVLYYHDGASSTDGFAVGASYAAFAHVIDTTPCRFVMLGGAAHLSDDHRDGLAVFKRGFANTTVTSYLCRANLARHRSAA